MREQSDLANLFGGITTYNSLSAPNYGVGRLVRDNPAEAWLVNSTTPYSSGTRYDYDYFVSKIPGGAIPAILAGPVNGSVSCASCNYNGYQWYTNTGGLTINSLTLAANQNVVIFVNGDLTIAGDVLIPAPTASKFFMAVVNGTLTVANPTANPATQTLEGVFVANQLTIGSGTTRLISNGSVVSWGGVVLNRNLGAGNVATPAELFNFRPDFVLRIPDELLRLTGLWREVNP